MQPCTPVHPFQTACGTPYAFPVHRDLKSANVLLAANAQVSLVPYSLAILHIFATTKCSQIPRGWSTSAEIPHQDRNNIGVGESVTRIFQQQIVLMVPKEQSQGVLQRLRVPTGRQPTGTEYVSLHVGSRSKGETRVTVDNISRISDGSFQNTCLD